MNICYVSEYFTPFVIGGAEVSTYHHAKALVDAGHRVVIVTPNYGAPAHTTQDDIMIYRYYFPKKLKRGELCSTRYFTNPLYYLYLALIICKAATERKCDVIHAQNTFSITGSYIASRILRIPFFVTLRDYMSVCPVGALCLHDSDFPPNKCSLLQYGKCFLQFQKKYHPHGNLWEKTKEFTNALIQLIDLKIRRFVLRRAEKVIAISDAIGRIYASQGIKPENIETIYNMTQKPLIDKGVMKRLRDELAIDSKKVILYVGKISFGKGVDVLLKAIPAVVDKIPNAYFIFAGRKNPLISVPECLKKNVKLLGHITNAEVQAMYSICNVVVIPSVWPEPFSRVALEASFVHEKPIVATRRGGIPEILGNESNVILINHKDPEQLSQSIIELLNNPAEHNVTDDGDKLQKWNEESVKRLLALYKL